MDTGADVKVLGRRPVTMIQAGDGAHLKGFIAGQFDVKAGHSTDQVSRSVAPIKDSMLLRMDFLRTTNCTWMQGAFVVFLGGG